MTDMNNRPIVSVIMPAYNGARHIDEAIRSVEAQRVPDWELIVIDDGSTDGTAEIVYVHEDNRIRYAHQANAGRSAARNRGLSLAKGKYVVFLDADDILLPRHFEIHLDFLSAHPRCDASISDCEIIDENGRIIVCQSALRRQFTPGYEGICRAGTCILDPLVVSPPLIGAPHNVMTRRDAIQACDAQFDPKMFMGEDWDFWLQLAANARFGIIDEVTGRYRWHDQNTLSSHDLQTRRDSLLRNRYRVLTAPYFDALRPDTRWLFFYQMLFDYLQADTRGQQALLTSSQFSRLDSSTQVRLLRMVALRNVDSTEAYLLAAWSLQRAAQVERFPSLTYLLWLIWQVSPVLFRHLQQLSRPLSKKIAAEVRDPGVAEFIAISQTNG